MPPVRRATVGCAVVAALVLALTACSSSSGKTSTSPTSPTSTGSTTTPVPGRAQITVFVVPKSVRCGSTPSTTVRVTYAVRNALRHQLIIDGRVEPRAVAPRGTVNPRVHCDGMAHTIALVAIDAAGRRTSQVKYLTTVLPKR
jgi:hypothetical protein